MKVLIAPAHERLIDLSSEYQLAYDLIRHIAVHPNIEIDVVTAYMEPGWKFPPNVTVHTFMPYQPNLNLYERFKMIFQWFSISRKLMKQHRYDIIHHMRPFKIHVMFNLLPLLGYTRGMKFIVGPVPAPHAVQLDDDWLFALGHKDIAHPVRRLIGKIFVSFIKLALWPFRPLSHASLRRADHIIGASEESKRLLATITDEKKITAIPCGVNVEIREHDWIPKNVLEIISVGYFIQRKNIMATVQVFSEVAARVSNVRLRLIGDGPERAPIEAFIRQKNLQDKVIFEGKIPHHDVWKFYHRADVFISTSHSETDVAPACMEAMACGLPVVVTETNGFQPIVKHGTTGFMHAQGDVHGVAESLARLLEDGALRARMGRQAQALIREEYQWPEIGRKFYELYREVLLKNN